MDRFENILVAASPGNLEANVLRAAVELADANRARLTVLDVLEPMTRMRRFMMVGRRHADARAELLRERSEQLRLLAETARAGDGTDVQVSEGDPSIEVIRHVLEHGNDLVIVGSREVEARTTAEFQGGLMQLLRKCPVPVWVMRPPRADELRILALIDPDPFDPVRDGLNDLVLALATSYAHREGGALHVGHACEPADETPRQPSPDAGSSDEVEDVPGERTRRALLGELLDRHDIGTEVDVHLMAGHAGEVLPRLAEDVGAGLIVMGTVARTGISGVVIGNTAETILQSVDCSVLAVKPEGFVTPIKPAKGKADSRR